MINTELIYELTRERDDLLKQLVKYKKFIEMIADGGSDKESWDRVRMQSEAIKILGEK